jgi:hypothetical protein
MNKRELQNSLGEPYNRENWKQIVQFVFPNVSLLSSPKDYPIDNDKIKQFCQLGTVRLKDGKTLALFELLLDESVNIQRNRVELNNEIYKYIDQEQLHGVLSVFEQGTDDYRFTFSAKSTEFDEGEGDFINKKTDTKRFTYVLGKNESCKTPADRFFALSENKADANIAIVQDAFSVERLSKEFFDKYKVQFNKFWAYIAANDAYKGLFIADSPEKRELQIRDFTKKLLGRIVFLHFLQKKGWMGCPPEQSDWLNGDKRFMQNLFADCTDKATFHSNCLHQLFYKTLNRKRPNDIFACTGLTDAYANIKIPYLNGGLFDSDEVKSKRIDFPEDYFTELLEFFGQYNFTIDENDPNDHEVGIDPEMLGHIFENLLEDNKDKGAFYTPKIIVQYMCQESLIEYLSTKLSAEPNSETRTAIEELMREQLAQKCGDLEIIGEIAAALYTVKICDPAIGSGAFPMGILNAIYKAVQQLYDIQQDTVADVWKISTTDWQPHLVKKNIIQHSIYGVDIESGAVDIARLRFWLALVVDETEPLPLPNLDYKIMQGNSLLESFEGIDLSQLNNAAAYEAKYDKSQQVNLFSGEVKKKVEISLNFDDIKTLMDHYFLAADPEEKKKLHKRIDDQVLSHIRFRLDNHRRDGEKELRLNQKKLDEDVSVARTAEQKERLLTASKLAKKIAALKKDLENYGQKEVKLARLSNSDERPFFLWHLFFQEIFEAGGFDIVIGNPPYLRIQGIREVNSAYADELIENYKSTTGSFDLYIIFLEQSMQLIKIDGVVNFIMPTKWTNAAFGKGIRKIINEKKSAYKIINFGTHQVFNASTYTGLQWFKHNSECLNYVELDRELPTNRQLSNFLNGITPDTSTSITNKELTENAWVLSDNETAKILDKLNRQSRRLSDVFDKIFQGLATSKDDVYFLYDCRYDNEYVSGFSKQLGVEITLETALTKPLLKGGDVHRYEIIKSDKVVIFPYNLDNGRAELFTEDEIKNLFPKGYLYLKECEQILRDREKGRLKNDSYWFRYIYPKNLTLFKDEKLVAPEISHGGNFSYDENGDFYSTTKIYGYIKKEAVGESYKFWLGLLNSSLFWFFIKNTGYVLRGGYYTFKTNYIKPFPIPATIPKEIVQKIETKVSEILTIRGVDNSRPIVNYQLEIDSLVYELYDFNIQEIKFITKVINCRKLTVSV